MLVFSILFFCSLSALAQEPLDWGARREIEPLGTSSEQLFSPSVGQIFYEIAYELANSEDVNEAEAERAIVFLIATTNLDSRANYVLTDMIKLACRYHQRDYSELVYQSVMKYVDESADLEVTKKAVWYLLEQLNSREQREELLETLLKNLGGKTLLWILNCLPSLAC